MLQDFLGDPFFRRGGGVSTEVPVQYMQNFSFSLTLNFNHHFYQGSGSAFIFTDPDPTVFLDADPDPVAFSMRSGSSFEKRLLLSMAVDPENFRGENEKCKEIGRNCIFSFKN